MKFGLFYQIQVPKPWDEQSEARRIWEALDQIAFAEEMGYDSVWFSEHHFRPVWSHNSAPDLTLAAVTQRTSRIRMGIGVVLAPIHHPLHTAARMATLDILSKGRVDVGLGRTGYPVPADSLRHRPGGHPRHVGGVCRGAAPHLDGGRGQPTTASTSIYRRDRCSPSRCRRPHPPLWSACASEETTRRAGELGLGALVGSEGGLDRVAGTLELYRKSLKGAHGRMQSEPAPGAGTVGATVNSQNALMTAGFCHEDPKIAKERGTELVGWYLDQQRDRAALVWRGVDPASVPPDYQGYYERDMRMAAGPHEGDPTAGRSGRAGRPLSASAPPTTASSSWSVTRRWALSRSSASAPSARPPTRKP